MFKFTREFFDECLEVATKEAVEDFRRETIEFIKHQLHHLNILRIAHHEAADMDKLYEEMKDTLTRKAGCDVVQQCGVSH